MKIARQISTIVLIILLNLIISIHQRLSAQEMLKMPEPTHLEDVHCSNLILEKIISPDFNTDLFFAHPTALTPSPKGLFVYDRLLRRIFLFNHKGKYVTSFLREGRGPGEVWEMGMGFKKIYYCPDNTLRVADAYNDKLIIFSDTGKYIKDIKMHRVENGLGFVAFQPVTDTKGNLYAYSTHGGIIDKYASDMTLIHSYLDLKENAKFVIYKPRFLPYLKSAPISMEKMRYRPDADNTHYCVTKEGLLLIYLARPSTVFIFKDNVLIDEFDIHLESQMRRFRELAMKEVKTFKKKPNSSSALFVMHWDMFLDMDNEKFFYLPGYDSGGKSIIYKFNLEGELVKMLKTSKYKVSFLAKRNHRFYGLYGTERNPIIFKEEKQND